MHHIALAQYQSDELAFMVAMSTGTDTLWSGVTVDARSDAKLDEIEGEAELDLGEIIPPAIGKESTHGEGGTQRQKNRQCA